MLLDCPRKALNIQWLDLVWWMAFWGCSNKWNRETEMLCSTLQTSESATGFLHVLQRRRCRTTVCYRGTQFFWFPCFLASVLLSVLFVLWLQERHFFWGGLENSEACIFLNFPVKYLLSQTENASFINCLNAPTCKRSTEPQRSFSKQIPSHYWLWGHDCSQETWKSSYSKALPIHVYLGLQLSSSD